MKDSKLGYKSYVKRSVGCYIQVSLRKANMLDWIEVLWFGFWLWISDITFISLRTSIEVSIGLHDIYRTKEDFQKDQEIMPKYTWKEVRASLKAE
jgi:hypothetical protein